MFRFHGFALKRFWSVDGNFDWKISARNAGIGLLVLLFALAFWIALPNATQQIVSVAGFLVALFLFLQVLPVVVLGFATAMILDKLVPDLFPYLVPAAQTVVDTLLPYINWKIDADLLLKLFAVSFSIALWWGWQAQPVLFQMMYHSKQMGSIDSSKRV